METLHCVDIKSSDYSSFKAQLERLGVKTRILSVYTSYGVRICDVEVERDNAKITAVEKRFAVSY